MPRGVATFCVPRVLYQVTIDSSKSNLKNIAKATSIYVVVVVLVMDRRFIQMRSLLQEVVLGSVTDWDWS